MQVMVLLRVQQILLAFVPLCVVAVYLVQRVYLRTSRQLRVLELELQSTLFSSIIETVQGDSSV